MRTSVLELYTAYFNRAADKDGVAVNAADKAIVDNKSAVSQHAYDTNFQAKDISISNVTHTEASVTVAKKAAAAPSGEGETYYLTKDQDILTGTDNDDTFIARGNNTLNNADIIDGGAGRDTVKVMLDAGETAESPLLTNIEVLQVQVQNKNNVPTADNDVEATVNFSNIDAGDMRSVDTYINK